MNRIAILILAVSLSAAVEWELPSIKGNAPDVWKEGSNWRWDAGNPMVDGGASWILLYQPVLAESALKPMIAGKAYDFNFVWRDEGDSFDPGVMFKERTLHSGRRPDGPGLGPVCAVVFNPGKAGTHRINLAATVGVQNPTAGHALATLAVCGKDRQPLRTLKEFPLNTASGNGNFPGDFNWNDAVILATGETFAVLLQSNNPGPATAGGCSLMFTTFQVSRK